MMKILEALQRIKAATKEQYVSVKAPEFTYRRGVMTVDEGWTLYLPSSGFSDEFNTLESLVDYAEAKQLTANDVAANTVEVLTA